MKVMNDMHPVTQFGVHITVCYCFPMLTRTDGRARGSLVVKALWYKPEGHEFDTR
jgi:hypothetical protein